MLKDIACIQFDKGPNVMRFIYESRKAFTFVVPIRSSRSAKETREWNVSPMRTETFRHVH